MKIQIPTDIERATSVRDRIAKVQSRFLSQLEDDAMCLPAEGIPLKIICALRLLDEARASLTEWLRTQREASK